VGRAQGQPVPGQQPPAGQAAAGEAPAEQAAPADEPAAPASEPGATFFSLHFVLHDQLSYREHPFYQLTGASPFDGGHSAVGNSFTLQRATSVPDEDPITAGYRALPSFGLEFGQVLDLPFPRAVSIGYDHIRLSQTDKQALDTDKTSVTIPRISMDSYYDMASFRIFAFDIGTPGLNYYVGIGLGVLNGVITAKPFASAPTEAVLFAQVPLGVTRFGVEAHGEQFGFRYEVNFTNADEVRYSKNPFLNSTLKEIDHSGVLIRVSITYQFNQN
jgi:hypothetical protein